MILPFVMMDLTENSDKNAGTNIESILYSVSSLSGIIKCTCIFLGQKKLGINIDAVIDDWLSVKNDVKARTIMRKYAYRTRILTFVLLYSAFACSCIYTSTTVFISVKQIFFTDLLNGKT